MTEILVAFLFLVSLCHSTKLPSFVTPCRKDLDSASLSRCILDEARKVQKEFCRGIPELGVESLDPLNAGDLVIDAIALRIIQKNVTIKGSCKTYIKNIVIDHDASVGQILAYGNYTATSEYDINGRLLLIPLTGKGKFKIRMENTEIKMEFKVKLVTLEDKLEHYVLHDVKSSQNIGNAKLRMDGLFGNDPIIGNTVNQVINENWRELMKDFAPPAVKAVTKKTIDIINSFYAAVPYNDLFA